MASFRGFKACSCLIEWLPVYEAMLLQEGVIKKNIDIYQLIGGAAASAGTHSKGGAFDIAQGSTKAIRIARDMGADATWRRPKNWDGRGGMAHTHGVLRGCPHNGPARYQIAAVDAGFNGLGRNGRGGKDSGPRPLSGRTYKQGIEWAEDHMALTDDDVKRIAKAVWQYGIASRFEDENKGKKYPAEQHLAYNNAQAHILDQFKTEPPKQVEPPKA